MKIAFLSSTPLNISGGSGTYVGLTTLAEALRRQGHAVDCITPAREPLFYTAQRIWFNERLRRRDLRGYGAVVGFDMDGFRLRSPYVASLKGVIADELRYERGVTRALLAVQAACERQNVHRAARVITTSRYSAARIRHLYSLDREPGVVPELIDLDRWRGLSASNPGGQANGRFTVLSVARMYPRKRMGVLVEAARRLESQIPGLEVRIAGDGPEAERLRKDSPASVTWLGTISLAELAREYNRCDLFCLPSVQEGFGIVFLEAMASGKPIVAVRASSVPEVVPHARLAAPGDSASLADGILEMFLRPGARIENARAGAERVKIYDAPIVARQFLEAIQYGV